MGNFESPLDKTQKKIRKKQLYPLIKEEIGKPFIMPDYVPETNEDLLAAFEEANRVAAGGVGTDVEAATNRLLSGDMGYEIDPAQREAYFQAQLAAANQAFDEQLRNVGEFYAGGYGGRSGDFQGGLADATAQYGIGVNQTLAELINQDESRKWEAGQNALQRLPLGMQAAAYNQMMPLNTLMNSGMTQYELDSATAQQNAQQQMYLENPLMNPIVEQWAPWYTQPYKVPVSGGGGGGGLGGLVGGVLGAALGPFGSMLGGGAGGLF